MVDYCLLLVVDAINVVVVAVDLSISGDGDFVACGCFALVALLLTTLPFMFVHSLAVSQ